MLRLHEAAWAGVPPATTTSGAASAATAPASPALRPSRTFRPVPAAAAYPAFYAAYRRLAADLDLARTLRTLRRLGAAC